MKIDGFLKVPDIPGPSERDGHEDEIEIHGVEFNMEAPHDPNSLSRRGRVALDMIVFTKNYDMASPYLKKALFDNTALDEVVFSARRTIEGETKRLSRGHPDRRVGHELRDASRARTSRTCIEEEVGFAYHEIKFVYDNDHEIEMRRPCRQVTRARERLRWPSRPPSRARRARRSSRRSGTGWSTTCPASPRRSTGLRESLAAGARRRARSRRSSPRGPARHRGRRRARAAAEGAARAAARAGPAPGRARGARHRRLGRRPARGGAARHRGAVQHRALRERAAADPARGERGRRQPAVARRLSRGAAQRGELRRAALRRALDPRLRPRRARARAARGARRLRAAAARRARTRVTVSLSDKTGHRRSRSRAC